jgi:hypothetical protein
MDNVLSRNSFNRAAQGKFKFFARGLRAESMALK